MFLTLPETSSAKILYDRQTRLNRRFPDHPIHIAPVRPSMAEITHTTLVRPTQIMLRNPAIAFGNLFTCLIYGIYYSFFESLPRVFLTAYSFTYQEVSLTFLSITLGGLLGVLVYLPWAFWWSRNVNKLGPRRPEKSLIPSLFGVCLIPVGLFLFGKLHRISVTMSADTSHSMDMPPSVPLVDLSHRRGHPRGRHILDLAMLVKLHPPRLPSPRRVTVRRERPSKIGHRCGGAYVQPPTVRKPRRGQGRDCACVDNSLLLWMLVRNVLLGGQVACQGERLAVLQSVHLPVLSL